MVQKERVFHLNLFIFNWRDNCFAILCWFLPRVRAKLFQSYPALCNSMDCSPPSSSVHELLQARILEWVAMSSSRGSSRPRDQTCISHVSCIGKWVFYHLQLLLYINMNQPQICLLPLETRYHLLPHPTPLGCHRAPDLGSRVIQQISTGYLILHMVMYMFQCYSLNSSPLPFQEGSLEIEECSILCFP